MFYAINIKAAKFHLMSNTQLLIKLIFNSWTSRPAVGKRPSGRNILLLNIYQQFSIAHQVKFYYQYRHNCEPLQHQNIRKLPELVIDECLQMGCVDKD